MLLWQRPAVTLAFTAAAAADHRTRIMPPDCHKDAAGTERSSSSSVDSSSVP